MVLVLVSNNKALDNACCAWQFLRSLCGEIYETRRHTPLAVDDTFWSLCLLPVASTTGFSMAPPGTDGHPNPGLNKLQHLAQHPAHWRPARLARFAVGA